jgi:DNA-binding MarR family transcriptional regulator
MTKATTTTRPEIVADLPSRLRFALMRLSRRLRQNDGSDATPSQVSALSSVEAHGSLTLGELAAYERVAPPSMTRIVSHLEERDLVLREVDASDRRVARVSITDAGRTLLTEVRNKKTAYLAERISLLSDEDRAVLQAALPVIERLVEDRP